MTLRSRLTLLFLAAVEVTFLSAIAAYWGLHSWRVVTDDLTIVHEQHRRLIAVLDGLDATSSGRNATASSGREATASSGRQAATASVAARAEVRHALDGLHRDAQTVDESEQVAALAAAIAEGSRPRVRHTVRQLGRYYHTQHRLLREHGASLARTSNALIVGIVLVVIATFLGFLAAIRVWFVEPVRALERATEIMSRGDLAHRIVLRGEDELARLAGSINHMAASLAHIQTQLVVSERFALLGELAAYVAHNIRNPLASIRATAQAEAIDLPDDDPRRGALADIVNAVDRLSAWVTDLLRSVSPVALERRPGSVSDLVARCVELVRPRLREVGLDLDVTVPPTPAVSFDQAKLEQVVSAVLANATEASPRGGRIAVTVAPDTDSVALRIDDQGPGVPADRRGRLFTPFSSNKTSGTGLGLWLSQKIVTAHGGTITLRDRSGGGTTVEIRLPIVEEPPCPMF